MNSTSRLPRPDTIVYDLIYGNVEQQKKTINKFKFVNTYFMNPLYRIGLLPLLGLSRIFLLLTTIGRKTGKTHITPLEYHRINDVIHIFSGRGDKSDWFKNLRRNPDKVFVKLGFRSFKSRVDIIDDSKEKLEVIKWYVITHPTAARQLFGWNRKADDPESRILDPVVDFISIIKLQETR